MSSFVQLWRVAGSLQSLNGHLRLRRELLNTALPIERCQSRAPGLHARRVPWHPILGSGACLTQGRC